MPGGQLTGISPSISNPPRSQSGAAAAGPAIANGVNTAASNAKIAATAPLLRRDKSLFPHVSSPPFSAERRHVPRTVVLVRVRQQRWRRFGAHPIRGTFGGQPTVRTARGGDAEATPRAVIPGRYVPRSGSSADSRARCRYQIVILIVGRLAWAGAVITHPRSASTTRRAKLLERRRQSREVVEDGRTQRLGQPLVERELAAVAAVAVFDRAHLAHERGAAHEERHLHVELE